MPILILLFGPDPVIAVGTSLVVIIFTTIVASVSYFRQGRIFFRSALCLILPSSICAILDASLTALLTGVFVALLFSGVVVMLSAKLLYPDLPFIRALKRGPFCEETCSDCFSITQLRLYYANYLLWGSLAALPAD